MKRRTRHIISQSLGLLFFLTPSCIEPFEPDISRYEEIMVVDGIYTDADEPMVVRISRSLGYYDRVEKMVEGAVVILMDEDGETGNYSEIMPGVYRLDKGVKRGEPGKSYKLIIETTEGAHYESDFQVLKKANAIERVYYGVIDDYLTSSPYEVDAIQVYLDSKDEEGETRYYRWDYNETWEYRIPHYKPGYEDRDTCWRNFHSDEIVIASTENLTEDIVYKKELYKITSETNRLFSKYSSLIRQYSISKEAYEFYRELEKINEQSGSLFDSPPSPVIGNIQNVDDPYEPVLGYFQVSGVSEKRVFIDRQELPESFYVTAGYSHCRFLEIEGEGMNEIRQGWLLLYRFEWLDTIYTDLTSHNDCYDCTVAGSNKKPSYWNEFYE